MKISKLLPFVAAACGALVDSTGAAWALEPNATPSELPAFSAKAPVVPLSAEYPAPAPVLAPVSDPLLSCALEACPPKRDRHFTFGVGTLFMQARFDNNMAFGVQTTTSRGAEPIPPPGSVGTRLVRRIEIDHNVVAVPEIWLGYLNDAGMGARVRYWYFYENTNQTLSGTGPGVNSSLLFSGAPLGLSLLNAPSVMQVTSKLNVQVLDVEGQYAFAPSKWNFLLSGGLRIAHIGQGYNAFVTQSNDNTVLSSSTFTGVGPTLGVELRRPILCEGLNLFGSVRGSMVYGSNDQSASLPDQNVYAQESRLIGVGITEMELGLEMSQVVNRSRLFGQVALVAQNWSGAGSASRSSVNVVPSGSFVGAAYSGDSDINFLGVAVRLGLNY